MKKIKVSDRLSMSHIAQGFWRLALWDWTTQQTVSFMHECISRGVTTFDTAQVYSATQCESLMGDAFAADKSIRPAVQLVSKTGIFQQDTESGRFGYYDTTYQTVVDSCKQSLKRLKTDYLDLYLIHREDPCIDFFETARALKDLKKEGLILEAGVSNFDPFKFDALNKAMDGQLVTNQIEWNPVCFEHFNSGMMDYLTINNIHPMIWSPLAGGRLFQQDDPQCVKAMEKIRQIARRHDTEPEAVIFAWLMYHPAGAVPLSGSCRTDRLDRILKAEDVKLEHYEWYEIYTASGQQILR